MRLESETSFNYNVHVSRQQIWKRGFVNDVADDLLRHERNHHEQSDHEVYYPLVLLKERKKGMDEMQKKIMNIMPIKKSIKRLCSMEPKIAGIFL